MIEAIPAAFPELELRHCSEGVTRITAQAPCLAQRVHIDVHPPKAWPHVKVSLMIGDGSEAPPFVFDPPGAENWLERDDGSRGAVLATGRVAALTVHNLFPEPVSVTATLVGLPLARASE